MNNNEYRNDILHAGLKVRHSFFEQGRSFGIPSKYLVIPLIVAVNFLKFSIALSLIVAGILYVILYYLFKSDPDAFTVFQIAIKMDREFSCSTSTPKQHITFIGN